MTSDQTAAARAREAAVVLHDIAIAELDDVNAVIAAAIDTWQLAPRVKRLVLPSYRYGADDFTHLSFIGARRDGRLLGVASFEPAETRHSPGGRRAMLLHGLYVRPDAQRARIGMRLLDAVKDAARERGFDGLLVRAERNAVGFFAKAGFAPLAVEDAQRDYPHRLWAELDVGREESD